MNFCSHDGSSSSPGLTNSGEPQSRRRNSSSKNQQSTDSANLNCNSQAHVKNLPNRIDSKSVHSSRATQSKGTSATHSHNKMADLNLQRGLSPHFSPSRTNSMFFLIFIIQFRFWFILNIHLFIAFVYALHNLAQTDAQTLHVHLPNHGFRMIRFDEASDVRQIINLIVGSMSPGQKTNPQSYALRLRHMLTREVMCSIVFTTL